jgi:hypothetical protein
VGSGAHPMIRAGEAEQRGAFDAAAVIGIGTARMERAAARWVDRVRSLAGDRLAVTVRVQSRDRL